MLSFPTYIDSTMLTTTEACWRKHYWGILRSFYPRGKSVHLIAGAAIAAGLEGARKHCFTASNPPNVPLHDLLLAAYPRFLSEWGDYEPPEESAKSFSNSWAALVHYLETYHPGQDDIQPFLRPDGSPAVEYRFAIPLEDILHPDTNEPILFVGRFDMVGVLRTNNVMAVVDEKTTGSLTYDWAQKWDLRGQFLGYVWALRAQGLPVRHAFVRGIAILKTKNEVRTAFVQYPDYMLDRWEHRTKATIRQMIERYKHLKDNRHDLPLESLYPYNFADACESYGGCAFASLCAAHDPEPFTSNYILHRFNPTERQPVEEVKPNV